MERFISEECYNEIMEMAAEMVAEAVINELNDSTVDKAYMKRQEKAAKIIAKGTKYPTRKNYEKVLKAKDSLDKAIELYKNRKQRKGEEVDSKPFVKKYNDTFDKQFSKYDRRYKGFNQDY